MSKYIILGDTPAGDDVGYPNAGTALDAPEGAVTTACGVHYTIPEGTQVWRVLSIRDSNFFVQVKHGGITLYAWTTRENLELKNG